MNKVSAVLLIVVAIVCGVGFAYVMEESATTSSTTTLSGSTETAVFSGGCFWGLQSAFDEVDGVVNSRVGYTGGDFLNPTYTEVVFGKTGHAEAVEVTFDPATVSFEELLQIHIDRVRPKNEEPATDYESHHSRAAVFAQNVEQRETTLAAISHKNLQSKHILIENASTFWEAETEHQNYLEKCAY